MSKDQLIEDIQKSNYELPNMVSDAVYPMVERGELDYEFESVIEKLIYPFEVIYENKKIVGIDYRGLLIPTNLPLIIKMTRPQASAIIVQTIMDKVSEEESDSITIDEILMRITPEMVIKAKNWSQEVSDILDIDYDFSQDLDKFFDQIDKISQW